jgi:hypothetical protein
MGSIGILVIDLTGLYAYQLSYTLIVFSGKANWMGDDMNVSSFLRSVLGFID